MKYFLCIVLLFGSIILQAQEKDSLVLHAPKIIGKLKLGQKVAFENTGIRFIRVISDSRCPKNVTCVWAGEAKVLLGIYELGKKIGEREIVISAKHENFPMLRKQNLLVKVFGLSPYPNAKNPIKSEDYCLELYITKPDGNEK